MSEILDLHLDNGLRTRLLQRPDTALAAVVVDVAAGSHDEPASFPGMAHFLEHLVFLGSRRFALGDGLIPFVQRLGGRVNATTRARNTRYFCEVPAACLDEALDRLLDMLVAPLLEPQALVREREVLQAEYSARAGDPQTLCESALSSALAPGHPLGDFHAGNAASLALEHPDFLPALHAFHRTHYQPAAMTLTLAASRPLDELRELAIRRSSCLPPALHRPPVQVPPLLPLRAHHLRLSLPAGGGRRLLAFALEGELPELEAASGLLDDLLQDESPGGLLDRLGAEGLCDDLRVRLPYAASRQGLLLMEFDGAADLDGDRLCDRVLDWLDDLRDRFPWPGAWDDWIRARRWRLQRLAPLDAALDPGLPARTSLVGLLAQLRPERMIRLDTQANGRGTTVEAAGFPVCLDVLTAPRIRRRRGAPWQLPGANPYLDSAVQPTTPLVPLDCLPGAEGQGVLFLGWRTDPPGLPAGLEQSLQRALRPILRKAAAAGVNGQLQAGWDGLGLALEGPAPVLRPVARDLLEALRQPPARTLAEGPRLEREARCRLAGELPIRQLLQRLQLGPGPSIEAAPILDPQGLERFWAGVTWDGMGAGEVCLDQAPPGLCQSRAGPLPSTPGAWNHLEIPGEAALLAFHPLETPSARAEAAWRLLATWLEPAFHQRLRGELQLGYALACGFRQLDGHRGLFFAVQSPKATVAELDRHLRAFLTQQRAVLARVDDEALGRAQASLRRQLQDRTFVDRARQGWHDRLAGLPAFHADSVAEALSSPIIDELLDAFDTLANPASRLVLANAGDPAFA